MNDIALRENQRSLTAADVREHVNLVQEVMRSVMKRDTHFGVIPGCKQPSLYKAGSEVLLSTFRIAISLKVEDLSTDDCVRYRVRAIGTHQQSGIVVGEGIGECSSNEDKYKWRKAVQKAEFDATPETRRRVKFGKDYTTQQVRTEPADVANTVLKMAKKRAQIDLTLTATAASDIFTQDIEDLPEEFREEMDPRREAYVKVCTELHDTILAITENLALNTEEGTYKAAEAWFELTEDEKRAIWVAPKTCKEWGLKPAFTTAERETIKSPAFRKAYYGDTAEPQDQS